MYQLRIIPSAQDDMDNFHGKIFENIKKKILTLSNNPRPFGAINLTKEEGYRLRAGDCRILYRIDDKQKEVIIYRIKHRKESYR